MTPSTPRSHHTFERMAMKKSFVLLALFCNDVVGFGIVPPSHETISLMQQAAALFHQAAPQAAQQSHQLPNFFSNLLHHHSSIVPAHHEHLSNFAKLIQHSAPAKPAVPHDLHYMLSHGPQELLKTYTKTLKEHPLTTKMMTGATLAVVGDAIAQKSSGEDEYDTKRAASFALFDSAYRALQHVAFPIIVATFHGQFVSQVLPQLADSSNNIAAAIEQTLASQLGIVPFLYYPAFFVLSAAVQGLNSEDAWTRAKDNFLPLMQRNLLFWLPVQMIQFAAIPEDLQIPFLSISGVFWTFILSVTAGSAKKYATEEQQGIPTIEQLAPVESISEMEKEQGELEKLVTAESLVQ